MANDKPKVGYLYNILNTSKALTDLEVNEGARQFRELANKLEALGPVFQLAADELDRCARRYEDYQFARKQK